MRNLSIAKDKAAILRNVCSNQFRAIRPLKSVTVRKGDPVRSKGILRGASRNRDFGAGKIDGVARGFLNQRLDDARSSKIRVLTRNTALEPSGVETVESQQKFFTRRGDFRSDRSAKYFELRSGGSGESAGNCTPLITAIVSGETPYSFAID